MSKPKYQPAFPITNHWHNELNHYNGMTLRDYMAAKAMQGIIQYGPWSDEQDMRQIAVCAYLQADAMLKAREA